jgi:hypothetical protein
VNFFSVFSCARTSDHAAANWEWSKWERSKWERRKWERRKVGPEAATWDRLGTNATAVAAVAAAAAAAAALVAGMAVGGARVGASQRRMTSSRSRNMDGITLTRHDIKPAATAVRATPAHRNNAVPRRRGPTQAQSHLGAVPLRRNPTSGALPLRRGPTYARRRTGTTRAPPQCEHGFFAILPYPSHSGHLSARPIPRGNGRPAAR